MATRFIYGKWQTVVLRRCQNPKCARVWFYQTAYNVRQGGGQYCSLRCNCQHHNQLNPDRCRGRAKDRRRALAGASR